jgi:hypothetical protein
MILCCLLVLFSKYGVGQLPIVINREPQTVTRNLYNALNHIRRDSIDVHLWIDALCINQEDDVEKSHQVQQMRDIYACSSGTIV